MRCAIANDVEVLLEPAIADHGRCVTADQHRPIRLEDVVVVKHVRVRLIIDCAAVVRNLAVVL